MKSSAGDNEVNEERDHHPTDRFVHEFCKVFGQYGVPEYGCGGLMFPDFLELQSKDSNLSQTVLESYQSCVKVTLNRQVGSRYFVTANAIKVIFLWDAAIQFLKFTGKDKGNKLEREVFRKLHDV